MFIIKTLPGEKGGVFLPPSFMSFGAAASADMTTDESGSYHRSQTLLALIITNCHKLRQVSSVPTCWSLFLEMAQNYMSVQSIFKGCKPYGRADCYFIKSKR